MAGEIRALGSSYIEKMPLRFQEKASRCIESCLAKPGSYPTIINRAQIRSFSDAWQLGKNFGSIMDSSYSKLSIGLQIFTSILRCAAPQIMASSLGLAVTVAPIAFSLYQAFKVYQENIAIEADGQARATLIKDGCRVLDDRDMGDMQSVLGHRPLTEINEMSNISLRRPLSVNSLHMVGIGGLVAFAYQASGTIQSYLCLPALSMSALIFVHGIASMPSNPS